MGIRILYILVCLFVCFQDDIDEWNAKILTYLSYGGGILSIVGCLISVITFEFFR